MSMKTRCQVIIRHRHPTESGDGMLGLEHRERSKGAGDCE
jgi:hypothetical protein